MLIANTVATSDGNNTIFQDQDQDCHKVESPRDDDQGLRTTTCSLPIIYYYLFCEFFYHQMTTLSPAECSCRRPSSTRSVTDMSSRCDSLCVADGLEFGPMIQFTICADSRTVTLSCLKFGRNGPQLGWEVRA